MKQPKVSSVLVAADFSKASGRDFTAGVLRYAREKPNWRITIIQTPEEFTPGRLKDLVTAGLDGILTTMAESPDVHPVLRQLDLPVVLVGSWHDFLKSRNAPYSIAVVDEEEIGASGARHLLSLGRFATFGFVHCPDPLDRQTSVVRKRGFRKELIGHGYDCRSFDHVADGPALERWLRGLRKPAGILAGHDKTAKLVLEACQRVRIRVPGDISVLGIDNDVLVCESVRPTLSSMSIDPEALGFAAAAELARLFRRRTANKQSKQIVKTRIRVVERETTNPVSPAAHLIEKAQEFISANRENPISVKDVVMHLGVSRRLVDLRFRQYAGESVLQAITRTRLEAAAERIRKYPGSISQAIGPLGFADVSYFSAIFKRQFGLSPAAYRKDRRSSARR